MCAAHRRPRGKCALCTGDTNPCCCCSSAVIKDRPVHRNSAYATAFSFLTSWQPLPRKSTVPIDCGGRGAKPKRAGGWREGRQRQADSEERINTEAASASQHTNALASLDVSFYTIMSASHRRFAPRAARPVVMTESSYDPRGKGVYQEMFLVLILKKKILTFLCSFTVETVAASNLVKRPLLERQLKIIPLHRGSVPGFVR